MAFTLSADDLNRYVQVPFKEYGYDLDGWDCWGVIHYILREHAGIDVPSTAVAVEGINLSDRRIAVKEAAEREIRRGWDPIEWAVAEPGDVVLFAWRDRLAHVGLMLTATKFISSGQYAGTHISDLSLSRWASAIEGFYRRRES